jgi:hypothetical protein
MKKYITIILVFCGIFSTVSIADVLIIDRIEQEKSFNLPSRGQTMSQVIAKFGEPNHRKSAIGDPPITEWKYDKFSVYFEHKWVIDSVVYKVNAEEKGPKSLNQ